jgi:hypothetical protein
VTGYKVPLVIVGGGLGGVAAALAASRNGIRTLLIAEHQWLGGQLTTQGVPMDEHRWVEMNGVTESYRQLRWHIRNYYRTFYPLTPEARADPYFNPGNAWVSRLSHEPRVAATVIDGLIAPHEASGTLTVMRGYRVTQVTADPHTVTALVATSNEGSELSLEADYVLDATECGDLLPLAGVAYVTGAEAQTETGEAHAVSGAAQPQNMQSFTIPFAVDYRPGEYHIIDKPALYDFWRSYQADFWPAPQLSFTQLDPMTMQPLEGQLFAESMDDQQFPNRVGRSRRQGYVLWSYRRILAQRNFSSNLPDVSMVNWPQNDYWLGSIIDVPPDLKEHHLDAAKQLSLSLLYWLQTEAPRPDGKEGYPGLRLRKDIFGSDDGLALAPYIRESRRIKAVFTVLEQHIANHARNNAVAERFKDTVGIGMYRIDLHPSTGGDSYIDLTTCPFQIPLGALIPVAMDNLLPACKNIGTTHITNGAYRLHPVEWNIGEVAALLVVYCLKHKVQPRQVYCNNTHLTDFQAVLHNQGIELEWPDFSPY